MKKPPDCEGNCFNTHSAHKGDVRRVRVFGERGFDYGFFNYCDNAIEEAEQRKMTIKTEEKNDNKRTAKKS